MSRDSLKSYAEHLAICMSLWSQFTKRRPAPKQGGSWPGWEAASSKGVPLAAFQWLSAGPDDGRNQATTWQEATACPRKASGRAAFSHLGPWAGHGTGSGSTTQCPVCSPLPEPRSHKPTNCAEEKQALLQKQGSWAQLNSGMPGVTAQGWAAPAPLRLML